MELENRRRETKFLENGRCEMEFENKRRETKFLENGRCEMELENKRRETKFLENGRCEMELENKRRDHETKFENKRRELRHKELELNDREQEREYQLQLKRVENKGNDGADNESFKYKRSIDYWVVPTQHKGEDVLEFFKLFEKTAKLHNIDEKRWHLSIGNKFNEPTRYTYLSLYMC